MEMTGLDPAKERIIEMATILTDGNLVEIATGPDLVIHQPDEILAAMDDWNKKHHGGSGLVDRVKASTVTEADAEAQTDRVHQRARSARRTARCSPATRSTRIAGSSASYMPVLEKRLHYRMVDVSTIKELARRWFPAIAAKQPQKKETHRALDDIRESIDELRFYRQHVFLPATPPAT